MRGKKRIAEWIRIGIFAAFCISLALLGVYQGSKWLADRGEGTAGKLAEFLWNHSLPEESGIRKDGSMASFAFPDCLDDRNPWNSYEKKEKDVQKTWEHIDPAYPAFLESRQFYIEHSYLEQENQEPVQQEEEKQKPETEQEPTQTAQMAYSMAQLADYDFLMKHFYNVHTSTTAGRDMLRAKTMLETDLTIEPDSSSPQILIYHSHSQEAFADSGENQTVVEVGDYLTELLQEKGFGVIHDRSVYDLVNGTLDRSKAYTYALEGITEILQENPQIQVILDIHRDGVSENTRLVTEVNGKPTARIMFFNGLSRTPQGAIEYLPNPYLNENLAFSFQMQLKAAQDYQGYTRKIYLKGLRYNLHLRPRSSLIEVGAQTNTFEEAKNAMEPLAEILEDVLTGK